MPRVTGGPKAAGIVFTRWTCVLGMPHTGDVALGFVPAACGLSFSPHLLSTGKVQAFSLSPTLWMWSPQICSPPHLRLDSSTRLPRAFSLAGSLTAARLCSRCSLCRERALPLTIPGPKHSSLGPIPSLVSYTPTAVLASEFLEDWGSGFQSGTRARCNRAVTTTEIHPALTTHLTLFQAYM